MLSVPLHRFSIGLALALSGFVFFLGATAVSQVQTPSTREARAESKQLHIYIPEGQIDFEWTSAEIRPPLSEFNAMGLRWEGVFPPDTEVDFYLEQPNGEWILAPAMAGEAKDGAEKNRFITQPVLTGSDPVRYRIRLARAKATQPSPVVSSVEIIALDTTDSNRTRQLLSRVRRFMSGSDLSVIHRAEWGADESYRFNSDQEEIWPVQYQMPSKFVIHHTASGAGGEDPAATVRAIYYWHAQVLGWGDIGYNYLIDSKGNIYEGRMGGDGSIGAHTYNDIKQINYNEGSTGIALLGCYEGDTSACSSPDDINAETLTAVTQLVGIKGRKFGIAPKDGLSIFHDVSIPNLVGHKDLDATLCPGNQLYADFKDIRRLAQIVYDQQQPPYRAHFVSSDLPDALRASTPATITVYWKNTGSRPWIQGKIKLKLYNASGKKPTALADPGWTSHFGSFPQNESVVEPGQMASFTVPILSKNETRTRTLILKLFRRKERLIGAVTELPVSVIQPLLVTDVAVTQPAAVLKAWRPDVTVTARNAGLNAFPAGTKLFLNKEPVASLETETIPGGTANWSFSLTPPQTIGVHELVWQIRVDGTIVPGSRTVTTIRVDKKQ